MLLNYLKTEILKCVTVTENLVTLRDVKKLNVKCDKSINSILLIFH